MMETDPNHNKNLVFINTTDKETKTCELAKKFLFLILSYHYLLATLYNVQIENKKRQLATLFTAYIVVRFLNLQHKIQITDTSGIGFKTDNLLKTIGKLIF